MDPSEIAVVPVMPDFKRLTPTNWTEPDPTSTQFVQWSEVIQKPRPMTGQDWARSFLAVELDDAVPKPIRDIFAVARGTLLYGWFFYPLFQLGIEQSFRTVEAAARVRYQQLGGKEDRPTFKTAIKFLGQQGAIEPDQEIRWGAARELRNRASHPDQQTVMPPGEILRLLQAAAQDINRLFASADQH